LRRIAITNQKGGSSKTTTAVNVAACLAEKGQSVLLIDLDAQAAATSWYGLEGTGKGILAVLEGEKLADHIVPTGTEHVHVLPATAWLMHADRQLAGEVGAETLLRPKLDKLKGYDFVLMDCPPTLGILTMNALTAAREVLVPVEASFMALTALTQLLSTVEVVRERLNPKLEVSGIVACRVDRRTAHAQEVAEILAEEYGNVYINVPVRENVRLKEAASYQQPVIEYDTKSAGAADYRALAQAILKQGER